MEEPIQNDNKNQFLENFLKGQKTTEVFEDLSFNEMIEKLNDLDFSDDRTYVVCDKNNPQNYMEISASSEIHNERQYINTEFRLFSQGVQQKCDVFPHGRFTHYTRADGNNSTDKGEEYWDKMKAEMQAKGGFDKDMIIFPDVQSYKRFAETGQINQKPTEERSSQDTSHETEKPKSEAPKENEPVKAETAQPVPDETAVQKVSPEAEKLFENFKSAETQDNIEIAKQQDIINILNAKIKQVQASQKRQDQTVSACAEVLKSNAYPKLNPIISALSERTQKSAEKKNDKIKALKKKIKKAQKKINRLKRKQQKNELLKGFISSLFDNNTDRSAYVLGMQALREDGMIRAEKKLDSIEAKIEKATAMLSKKDISNVKKVKLEACIKKLEGQRDVIKAKINDLTELDQNLNKLAETDISVSQLEEIKETAMQNAAGSSTVTQAVDGMTSPDVTSTIQNAVQGENIDLGKRTQQPESKRDKLIDKATGIGELNSESTKIAKTELVDDKIDEIKNTSAETADKSAMKGSTVIDNQAETSTETIQQVIEPESKKEQKTEESKNQEQTAKTPEKPKIQAVTLRNLKPEEAASMLSAGIEFSVVKRNDGSFSAIFNKADAEKVRKALSEKQTQSQNMKR